MSTGTPPRGKMPRMDPASLRLETSRLVLRPPRPEDFDAFAAFQADAETMRFLGSAAQPRSLAWRGFLTMAGAWAMQGFGMFAVIEKESGRWVGRVGPWHPEGWPGTEVGWGIVHDRCRLGYATEAATAAIDWAFAALGWHEVIHVIDLANLPSQGVARKLGSRNRGRGQLPAPFTDNVVDVWGQTKAEWRARRGADG
jgi:RimJ/RimL family protein N-acetyltransferase